ncbi:uracil-xanthine permease family protein [Novispirillum sp. DQ9]|uniref:uracil-xanthine permease family protein n=1 Tax=Novispirillum sp. DQ9 TaxID=3398612 RepID=UPI003C7E7A93
MSPPDRPQRTLPQGLVYGVDDVPPPATLAGLALQHLALVAIFLIVAVTLARLAGLEGEAARALMSMTLLAGAFGAAAQAFGRFGIGSGYLIPATTTTILLPPSAAALAGGASLAAVMGMTVVSGLGAMALSRVIARLRPLFPPEITGFVVFIVGLSVITLAMRNFLGIDAGSGGEGGAAGGDRHGALFVATATLAVMVGLSVWGTRQLRLFSPLVGMAVGYGLAFLLGVFDTATLEAIAAAPAVALPRPFAIGLGFDAALLVPFAIAAVALALNSLGAVNAAQKVNEIDWKRPDLARAGRGALADGLTCVVAGLLGGAGQAATSGAVGLSQATGATSRVIGYAIAAGLAALAFLPQVAAVLLAMPEPVAGAALTFSGCFLVVNGVQMIASRMLDARKVFVLGIALSFGLARALFPGHFDAAPEWLAPWVSSPMALGVSLAVALNAVFRIGIWRRDGLTVDSAGPDMAAVSAFLEEQGALCGARPEVVHRARFAVLDTLETLIDQGMVRDTIALGRHFPRLDIPGGLITIRTRFDEFTLNVDLSYRGTLLEPRSTRPSEDEIMDGPAGMREFSRYMIGRAVDKVQATRHEDQCILTFSLRN